MSQIVSAENTKYLEANEILFLEGDLGQEMYIIKRGHMEVLKREGTQMVTLATLGPGSVLGELSLLDAQPRSATAKATHSCELVIIDQNHLNKTYDKLPSWLSSLIKILVQRLRDTNQKKHIKDLVGALPITLNILCQQTENQSVLLKDIAQKVKVIYGLNDIDFKKILKLLRLFQFIEITQGSENSQAVIVTQQEALKQYYEFITYQNSSKSHPWANLTETDLLCLQILIDTAKNRGSRSRDKLQFNDENLKTEAEAQGIPIKLIASDNLKTYTSLGILEVENIKASTSSQSKKNSQYLIDPEVINQVIRFQTRLDYFNTSLDEYFLI